ncbi:hypothetical protein CBL_09729 [Carabus blaptoides fortunei]
MSIVETCCFYFSTRLGSIVVGVFNLLQIIIWSVVVSIFWNNATILSDYIDELLLSEEVYSEELLMSIQKNQHYLLGSLIGFLVVFAFTCAAMIFGVYKFKTCMVYPFMVADFVYITSLLIVYVVILVMRKKECGLGFLILYSVLGEFIFLYLYYTWICVVGYCQIMHELRKRMKTLNKIDEGNTNFTISYKEFLN